MGFFENRKKNKLKKFLKSKRCSDSLNETILKQIEDGSITAEYQISRLINKRNKSKYKSKDAQIVSMNIIQRSINLSDCEKELSKITDDEILAKLAKNKLKLSLRDAENFYGQAVEKIDDEDILVDVAKNSPFQDSCRAAVGKINNQSVLMDIVKNGKNGAEAARRITNQKNCYT